MKTRAKRKAGPKKPRKPYSRLLKDGSLKESVIQRAILDWLDTTGLMFWRQNAGEMFFKGRKLSLGPVGCADISVVLTPNGRFLGLEIKSANGKPNKDQVKYAAALTKQGGLYFIVRSVADAKDAIAQALGEDACKFSSGTST